MIRPIRTIRPILSVAAAASLLGALCSCGHNAVTFGKGVGFEAGFDPEHMTGRVELLYGEMLNVAARDNLEITLETDVEGGQETAAASAKTGTALRIKVGPQVNGYFVDAVSAGATADQIRALHDLPASPDSSTVPPSE